MLGVDSEFINDYLIAQWIDNLETVGQLRALGESLMPLFGKLFGENADEPQKVYEPQISAGRRNFLKGIVCGNGMFTLTLNSQAVYGIEGLEDMSFTVQKKQNSAGETVLSLVSLVNVYNKSGTEKTTLSLAIDTPETTETTIPSVEGYFDFEGIDSLLLALARSATHINDTVISGESEQHKYRLNDNFYIDGNANLGLKLGSIDLIEVNIRVIAVSVNVDESFNVGLNIRLEYDALRNGLAQIILGDDVIINGDTVLDVTIKNGMVYMKRVQTSEYQGNKEHVLDEAEYITLYRAMPLENFTSDILGQLGFLFNLSDKVYAKIMELIAQNSTGSPAAVPADVGGKFKNYINGFDYTSGESESWKLTLNGAGLTGSSSFGAIVVNLACDSQGLVRTLDASMSIVSVVNISANLKWENPGAKMSPGVTDVTTDVRQILESGMSAKLKTVDWTETPYLEGQFITVKYVIEGEEIGSQDVAFSTDESKELYADLSYPSLSKYMNERPGYTPRWDKPSASEFKAGMIIYARYQANVYNLEFRSSRAAQGYTYNASICGFAQWNGPTIRPLHCRLRQTKNSAYTALSVLTEIFIRKRITYGTFTTRISSYSKLNGNT